jgi:para-aminobenzoate synthetase / 4-amino-4-deoxychorismate lyase
MALVILDFIEDSKKAPTRRVYTDPVSEIVAHEVNEIQPAIMQIEKALQSGLIAVGYIAYECATAFDAALRVSAGNRMPLLWFGTFRDAGSCPDGMTDSERHSKARASTGSFEVGEWRLDTTRARYNEAVAYIRQQLGEGRSYQVNYTTRLRSTFRGDAIALYEQLRRAQRRGLHSFLDLGRFKIVSLSPELFFRRHQDTVVARPMKGTRRRGRWLQEDLVLANQLLESEKDRAENLMIVDLIRNDLGKIGEYGKVLVPALHRVERYPTVHQMTSTITAKLKSNCHLWDLLSALFPCGSITGAPKVSTMEIISELEESPREVYCGAIGEIMPDGSCVFSVAIRTAWIDSMRGTIEYGVGGGITWGSTPEAEYDELLAKTAILTEEWPEFDLFETVGVDRGHFVQLLRHLRRLRESCAYFGFPYPAQRIISQLRTFAGNRRDSISSVRISVDANGEVRVTEGPLSTGRELSNAPSETDNLPWISIASKGVRSTNRFLYHKTTHRSHLEELRARGPKVFDVLLWNERKEVTEFTRGNVVLEINGELITPARDSGLLAGVFRGELIDRGVVRERTISLGELAIASRIWFINSLRGWVPVKLSPTYQADLAAILQGDSG